jgi:formylglycine-generating enzyme required for sulfatase activity
MNKTILMTTLLLGSVAGLALAAPVLDANPTLSQDANSRQVTVQYKLTTDPAVITVAILTNGVALAPPSMKYLSGDVSKTMTQAIEPDADNLKTIVWDVAKESPGSLFSNAVAKITAYPTNNPPLYLVIDLSGGTGATCYPCRRTSQPPDFGELTNAACRTTELWLRYIPAGTFIMGAPSTEPGYNANRFSPSFGMESVHAVTLTHDYYIGVFEVTQRQWELVMGNRPSFNTSAYWADRPVEQVSYNDIRGALPALGLPTAAAISPNSFLAVLRAKTGLALLDLPSEAQWERACRAESSSGQWNDGSLILQTDASDTNLNRLARTQYNAIRDDSNGNRDPATYNSARVGSYLPNAWKLYDMHGNINELCKDRPLLDLSTSSVTDPIGPTTGVNQIHRGGGYASATYAHRAAARCGVQEERALQHKRLGFRLANTVQ